jgi:hypothetical protein
MLEIPELDLYLNKGATKKRDPIVGNEMWKVAARSNKRPKVIKLNGKIISNT